MRRWGTGEVTRISLPAHDSVPSSVGTSNVDGGPSPHARRMEASCVTSRDVSEFQATLAYPTARPSWVSSCSTGFMFGRIGPRLTDIVMAEVPRWPRRCSLSRSPPASSSPIEPASATVIVSLAANRAAGVRSAIPTAALRSLAIWDIPWLNWRSEAAAARGCIVGTRSRG